MSPRRSSRARSSNAHSGSHQSSQSSRGSRHKRHDDKDDPQIHTDDGLHDGEDLEDEHDENASGNEEDEGETRCVCGLKEYLGGSDDGSTDATDGLFIQCDQCKVWQHGLCVGIKDTALAPENYFCEICKPSYHILYEKKGGRKYSNYIGIGDGPENAHSKDHSTKRRSTMNSRDAAYDEAALIQRALEESKAVNDKKPGNPRSRKRGTSEGSDEIRGETKRQRTSNSPDKTAAEATESMDDKAEKTGSKKGRGSRNAVAANNNNNSNSSSSKRSSNRNRGRDKGEARREESEQSDEHPRSTRNNHKSEDQIPTISTPVPEAPDTPSQPKRNGRAASGRRQRNRNRNRQSEDPGDASSQVMTRDHSMTGVDHSRGDNVIDKPAKPRLPGSRTTLQEMRKRVNGISDFIARTQVEMAEDKKRLFAFSAIVTATSPPSSTPKIVAEIAEQAPKMPVIGINGSGSSSSSSSASPPSGITDVSVNGMQVTVVSDDPDKCVDVASLQSTEIMDLLMRKVHQWECTYGRQGEKI